MLYNHEKWTRTSHSNMDAFHKENVEWKKSGMKEYYAKFHF